MKFRGVWGVADDREEADRLPIVHGDESGAPIGDASVLLIRLGYAKPVRHSRQELGTGRAAFRLKPDEPHRATIAHRSTTPRVLLPSVRWVEGGCIAEVVAFHDPALFPVFGLPATARRALPAGGEQV